MKVLFTSVSAHGHLLPLVPLMRAALDAGHEAAVVVSPDLAEVVASELPAGVRFLPAGPTPFELATEAARRTGGDVMHPTAEGVGETFGGVLLDHSVAAAVPVAREWGADVVVADMYSTLGEFLAAALDVPWHRFVMTVDIPVEWAEAIDRAAAQRFSAHRLPRVAPTSTLDAWPTSLGDGVRDPSRVALRAQAHTGPGPRGGATPAGSRPRVLVTLGTTFSDAALLRQVVTEVAAADVDVVATRGMLLGETTESEPDTPDATVDWVSFTPLDELLDGVTAVVSVGGAGTVLAALSRGIPLVLWPQGADQPHIAGRVGAAGAGVVVTDLGDLPAAVRDVLRVRSYRDAAAAVAAEIATAATPQEVVDRLAQVAAV